MSSESRRTLQYLLRRVSLLYHWWKVSSFVFDVFGRDGGLPSFVVVTHRQGRLLRRQLEEAEAANTQLHAEMAAVRSQKEATELEHHKLVLVHQSDIAGGKVQVRTMPPPPPPPQGQNKVTVRTSLFASVCPVCDVMVLFSCLDGVSPFTPRHNNAHTHRERGTDLFKNTPLCRRCRCGREKISKRCPQLSPPAHTDTHINPPPTTYASLPPLSQQVDVEKK